MAIAGFLIVVLFPVWPAVILGAILFLAWTSISQPATMSLIAKVLPQQKRTMGVSMHSLVRRIPMAIGPVLGGFFIRIWGERTGVRYAFVVAAAMGVVAIALQHWLIQEEQAPPSNVGVGAGPEGNPLRLIRGMSESLRSLLVADILIRFCEQIPYAFVVLWAMKSISNPVTGLQFGVLTSIEMATAIAVYLSLIHI